MLSRRGFMSALAVGASAIVVPELVLEPRRRFWQVSRNAPVREEFLRSVHRRTGAADLTFDPSEAMVFYQNDAVEHPIWIFSAPLNLTISWHCVLLTGITSEAPC